MSNPNQKSGNFKQKKKFIKPRKGDGHVKAIARQEVAKQLKKKVESKMFDISSTAFAVDAHGTSSIINLTAAMVQGVESSDYVGQSILPTHLRIRWSVIASDNHNMVRVIVIQLKAGSGVPIGATLMQFAGSVNTPLSPFDRDYSNTYRVLYDEFYQLILGQDNEKVTGDIRIQSDKLKKIMFDSGTGTETEGALYLCMLSDSTAASHPVGQFCSRLYYKDA